MLIPIPALNDNYIWLYGRENLSKIVIDIPEFLPLHCLTEQNAVKISALLLTHNHSDHVAGVAEFKQHFPDVPIFGPSECAEYATHIVDEGEILLEDYRIEVIPSGGHTANHVSYYVDGHLFCGDTLFSGGCGRVFTGDYAQMFASIERLNQLPEQTLICPGHEYTLSNLAFAESVLSDKTAVQNQQVLAHQLREQDLPTVPTSLALERQINPFLQAKTLEKFTALRKAKDEF